MLKLLITCLSFFSVCHLGAQNTSVYDLRLEHKVNPLGVDTRQPRFSWKLQARAENVQQTAYSIRVFTSPRWSSAARVWESGKMTASTSVLVDYAGPALQSGKKYYWQVMIWDNNGKSSAWSDVAHWQMGLLDSLEWKASWIEQQTDTVRKIPALLVRKEISLPKAIASATLYSTAHGLYTMSINGKPVSGDVLTPGWTSYNKRLQYQVYDVTSLLKRGPNAISAMLGDGWYRGPLAWENNWGIWGKKLGLLAQLEINYTDGTREVLGTDETWRYTLDGPITLNGIYEGETYDARKEKKGWQLAGYDDRSWNAARKVTYPRGNLIATETVPVRRIQEIKPIRIFRTPKGTLVADLGQNMVGWVRLNVTGPAGTMVTIRHAEVLDKYGEFYTANLRDAAATARYVLKGEGREVYEPTFTFFGFRYIAIDGFPGELKPENLTGVVVHSDMALTGNFTCSDSLVNQLQHNIQWGQKGNFLDVPTDCPQRDERLGWTGDAQAFVRTAAFNMDVAAFFTKWMKDVAADQYPDGGVPFVVPDALVNKATSAGWGDVATIAPWTLYQVYGDRRLLEVQYPSMKAYVEHIRKKAGETYLWKGGSVFGDWLFYKSMRQTENDGYTNPDMIATMFYAWSTKLLAQAAAELGKTADRAEYEGLFQKIKANFVKHYVTAEGRVSAESQTGYVLALMFDLIPENLKANAAGYLAQDIRERDNHLSTGFLGTPYLCHVLSDNGYTDLAYSLLLQKTFPSWLYPVRMGATTIWERWDGQKTDSTFQDVGMNSFNHYAYGAIGDWMYRVVAGIELAEPGYKKIRFQPRPNKSLSFASANLNSPYGEIRSGWERKTDSLVYTFTVPPNTTAVIVLPVKKDAKLMEADRKIRSAAVRKDGEAEWTVGSGTYRFIVGN